MNIDGNLEEDVQNLNDKVSVSSLHQAGIFNWLNHLFSVPFKTQLKKLQEQIEMLSEAQMKNEIKYTSMKRENGNLNDK